jgi:hypothetical protein
MIVQFPGKSLSRIYREVGVKRTAPGLCHATRSISFLSPIVSFPFAFFAMKIASLIFRPDRLFLAFSSFHSHNLPTLRSGSSSLISRRRHSLSVSRGCLRPPGNIHAPSRRRLTSKTLPRFAATSLDDLVILGTAFCESHDNYSMCDALQGMAVKRSPMASVFPGPIRLLGTLLSKSRSYVSTEERA